jgi:hypothetical protein
MSERDPLGLNPHSPDELADALRNEFPGVHVDWKHRERGTRLSISSRSGSCLNSDVVYPADVDAARSAIRQMLRDDSLHDLVADVLVNEMGGYAKADLGNAPYILRWLVLAQHVLVTIGDDAEVGPVFRSTSLAVLRSLSRRLKLWRDGAAVLHFEDAGSSRTSQSQGLDLTRISLKDFQTLWLSPPEGASPGDDADEVSPSGASAAEAAALELLVAYDDGAWLRHPRFVSDVLRGGRAGSINWHAANHLSTVDTEATVQDRAILAVACHLSGEVDPDVPLADALHFVGDAALLVLESMRRVAGAHPEPGRSWPTDCSPSCP